MLRIKQALKDASKAVLPSRVTHFVKWARLLQGQAFSVAELDREFDKIKQEIDIESIGALYKQYYEQHLQDPECAAKYPDIDFWLRLNIVRAVNLGLHKHPKKRILDLGCGSGYFLRVARHFGHDAIGIDVPDEYLTPIERDVFARMLHALRVKREIFVIRPGEQFRRDLGSFDLITSFLVCFNNHKTEAEWGGKEWNYFFNDIASILNPGGEVFLNLNRNEKRYGSRAYYDEVLERYFKSLGQLNEDRLIVAAEDINAKREFATHEFAKAG